jgi:hypothetical protein
MWLLELLLAIYAQSGLLLLDGCAGLAAVLAQKKKKKLVCDG